MSDFKRALLQVWYTNKAFRRNPAAAFFTLVFPIMFLVIFSVIFGNNQMRLAGGVTGQRGRRFTCLRSRPSQ